MSLVVGIVGLPNVGKSSLFNLLTQGNALVENRAFATIDPNLGVVKLPDERVNKLAELVNPQKVTYSMVKFLDIAGLIKGASQGEGLGNKFLENIRGVDSICLVVRAFEDKNVMSVNSCVDPIFEAEIVLCELIYSDLQMIENVLKKIKSNDKRISLFQKIITHLKNNKLLKDLPLTKEEKEDLKIYSFLTDKPFMVLANVDDGEGSEKYLDQVKKFADDLNASFIAMNVKLEYEVSCLPEKDREEFLEMSGKKDLSFDKFISLAFHQLNLRTFFTVGEKEVRSWTFKLNSSASECAGIIHTDIKRGFIKAKVIKYEDFISAGSMKVAKEEGKISFEGKDYIVQDGDIVHFEFNI